MNNINPTKPETTTASPTPQNIAKSAKQNILDNIKAEIKE